MSAFRLLVLTVVLIAGNTLAAAAKAATDATSTTKDELIFSASPREGEEEAIRTYQPIADYLSKVTGKKVVFQWAKTWGLYRTKMVIDAYDIVFDGPHFVSYRILAFNHHAVAKFSESLDFAIVSKQGGKMNTVSNLSGNPVCSQVPPNLGSLVLLSQFSNAAEKPFIVPAKGWDAAYNGVLTGKCQAGILPFPKLRNLDKTGETKILYKSQPMPNQAFSVSSRVSAQDRAKIAAALIAPEALKPTERMRNRFEGGDALVAATDAEYAGFADLLKNQWGFSESLTASK